MVHKSSLFTLKQKVKQDIEILNQDYQKLQTEIQKLTARKKPSQTTKRGSPSSSKSPQTVSKVVILNPAGKKIVSQNLGPVTNTYADYDSLKYYFSSRSEKTGHWAPDLASYDKFLKLWQDPKKVRHGVMYLTTN